MEPNEQINLKTANEQAPERVTVKRVKIDDEVIALDVVRRAEKSFVFEIMRDNGLSATRDEHKTAKGAARAGKPIWKRTVKSALDILWRNTAVGSGGSVDGSVDAWIMNGFTIVAQWFPGTVSLDWLIRRTPDVNGNGVNSVLWSNVITGQQAIWTSNGSTFVPGAPFAAAPPVWLVQP
jgi:hypothetical protein